MSAVEKKHVASADGTLTERGGIGNLRTSESEHEYAGLIHSEGAKIGQREDMGDGASFVEERRNNDTDDEDGNASDDSASCQYASSSLSFLEDDEASITSMKQLVEKYFGVSGAFRPRYSLAQAKIPASRRASSSAQLDDCHVAMLTHDCVIHFLAPHEILSLWRTNKATWSMVPKQRVFVMQRSVFAYLRISEEAAQHVHNMIIGGWRVYCPLMALLCEHLARVYGSFEPDVAHRVFMAHQMCFFPKSRGFWRCGSELAEHEVRFARVLDFRERHMINYSQPVSKLPPPTMDVLMLDSHLGWGDAEPYFERERVGIRQGNQKNDVSRSGWLKKHQAWMRENVNDAPNSHYRWRLERGLSPCIWVDQYGVRLSPDNELEVGLWALGIGSKRQQFVGAISSRDCEKHPCSFAHCLEYEPSNGSCLRGGLMELILRRSHPAAFDVNHEYDDGCWPTLGILIWCMRRRLEPFVDARIDWKAIIYEVCRRDSELFRRFYREGLVPWDPFGPHAPRPDPVDQKFIEREQRFYMDALSSPLFGPAYFHKYV